MKIIFLLLFLGMIMPVFAQESTLNDVSNQLENQIIDNNLQKMDDRMSKVENKIELLNDELKNNKSTITDWTGLDEITIALIGAILTGIGIIIAIKYNIKAINQNSKNNEYLMTKDFFEKFHEIQNIPEDDVTNYVIKINNFSQMVLDLHLAGIVNKNMITENLITVFREAYWFHNSIKDGKNKEMEKFDQWCDENKIKPESPTEGRTQYIESITREKDSTIYVNKKPNTDKKESN